MTPEELELTLKSFKNPILQKISRRSTGRFSVNITPYISQYKEIPTNYLEIGVYDGRTTQYVLDNILLHPQSVTYCIDPWDTLPENISSQKYNMPEVLKQLTAMQSIYKSKLKLLKGLSSEVLLSTELKLNSFDIIYIDGMHRAKNVLQDWALSWPLLKVGGIMVFDDYLANKEDEVMKAVDFILFSIGRTHTEHVFRRQKYKLLFKNIQVGIRKWEE